jgi:transposase
MKAYSIDLRERVLSDFQGGMKFADLGRKYSVSAEWVRQFIRRYQATGEIAARPPLTKKVPFYRRHETELRTALAEQPDLTLEGLRTCLKLDVSIGTLHQALVNLKLSFKKKRKSQPSSIGPTSQPSGRSSKPSKSLASIRTASCFLMKPGSKPT